MKKKRNYFSLFKFEINNVTLGFWDALPLLYREIVHIDEENSEWPGELSYPTVVFNIGKNIDKEFLIEIWNEIQIISNTLFTFGLSKAALIFDPELTNGENENYIQVYLDFFEPNIDGVPVYDWGQLNDDYYKPYSVHLILELLDDHNYRKMKSFKSCEYLGVVPFITFFNKSLINSNEFNQNFEIRKLLENDLQAKWFDRISYYKDFPNDRKIYDDQYSWNKYSGLRMCELCRDSGCCLGINEHCGFI